MKNAIAAGIVGLALFANGAAAQTAAERAQILREFEQSVDAYRAAPVPHDVPRGHQRRHSSSEDLYATGGDDLPPADCACDRGAGRPRDQRVATTRHAAVLEPFPANELVDFPVTLSEALPRLPVPLEYRLIDNDLVIRDANRDLIVAVLRNALGATTTR